MGQSLDFNLERFPTPESSRRKSDTVFTWSYLSQSRKLRILFPQTNRKQWCLFSQHVDLGVLGSWAQALPRGSLVLFLWVAPLRWSRSASTSLTPFSPWSCEQQQLPGWSLSPPSLLTPPWTGQKWGDVIATRTCLGTRGRGVVTWTISPGVLGGTVKDKYYIILGRYSSICVQNFRKKQNIKVLPR